jgi:hypothetical protein
MNRELAAVIVLAAAFAPTLAAAQVAGAGVAPAVIGGENKPFTIGVQETTSYDTNPSRGSSINSALRGLHTDDLSLSPSVTATYSRGLGLYGVALNGSFGYDYHPYNKSLDAERLSFSLAGNARVGSICSAGGNARYDRGQTALQYLAVGVTKNITQAYTLNGSESCSTHTGLTESVSVTHAATQNASSQLVNYDTTGVSGLIGYTNRAIGTVGITASYNETSYAKSAVLVGATPRNLDVTSVGLQITRPIGARLSGSASVSYSHSTQGQFPGAVNTGQGSFSGLTSAASLTYLVGPRLHLNFDVSRAVGASFFQGVGYSVVTQVGGSATYKVSSRISVSAGGNWSHTDYRSQPSLIIPALSLFTPGWQDSTGFFATGSVQLGRRSQASLNYRHEIGDSNVTLYNYVSDYVGLTLSTSF